MGRRNAAVEITITGRSLGGEPVETGDALDAMAAAVHREIQARCDATLGGTTVDGLLFRLTLPGVADTDGDDTGP
ncbi:MAG: hypothetical protein WD492_07690 [Alkalispirochaeta sp.]